MARFGNAGSVVAQNAIGMAALGSGVVSVALGLGAAFDAATDALREVRYTQSLSDAMAHAGEMSAIASAAISYTIQLEREIAELKAACAQRQEVIDILKARHH